MRRCIFTLCVGLLAVRGLAAPPTEVAIHGENFFVNGQPTYAGRSWQGHSIEGLLFNSRMVQGVFDDLNPATRARWNYPDGAAWRSEEHTSELQSHHDLVCRL